MSTNYSLSLPRTILFMLLSLVIVISLPSCEDSFLTYNITIYNNTSSDLNIYEKGINSSFHKIGEVEANTSVTEKGFFIDTEYTLEVRKHDGTVVQTRVFNQGHDSDKEWIIE